MRLRLTFEAQADVRDARLWYRAQRSGLDRRFLDAVEAACELLERNPELGPTVEGRIRRVLLRGFTYGVFYVIDSNEIVVIACLHGARSPREWRHRGAG